MIREYRHKGILILTLCYLVGVPLTALYILRSVPFDPGEFFRILAPWATAFWLLALFGFHRCTKALRELERAESPQSSLLLEAYIEAANLPQRLWLIISLAYLAGSGLVALTGALAAGWRGVQAGAVIVGGGLLGLLMGLVSFAWYGSGAREVLSHITERKPGEGEQLQIHLQAKEAGLSISRFLEFIPPALSIAAAAIIGFRIYAYMRFGIGAWHEVLGFGAFIIFAAALTSVLFSRALAREFGEMEKVAASLAKGDLTADVRVVATREMRSLALSLHWALWQLKNLIRRAKESAFKLLDAAREITSSAEQQSTGATEHAAAINEISSSMEELSRTADAIAGQGEVLNRIADEVLSRTDTVRMGGIDLRGALESLKVSAEAAARRAAELGEKVAAIGKILDLLEDIARETKLLAFNATIEAVSAGEVGRRFSVVAGQIKDLATQTSRSTDEIRELIHGIQMAAQAAVLSAEEQQKEVLRAWEKAEAMRQAIDALEEIINENLEVAQRISTAMTQQKAVTAQVAATLAEMTKVTQESAAGSKQALEAAKELAKLAEKLKEEAEVFKVE